LPKYTYKVIKSVVEEAYLGHTNTDIYQALGDVDFDKVKVVVEADDIYEAEQIRKGVTDIRMWDLESEV
jgi:uracil DNA glycosylase